GVAGWGAGAPAVGGPGSLGPPFGAVVSQSRIPLRLIDRAAAAANRDRGVLATRCIPPRPSRPADRRHRARDKRRADDAGPAYSRLRRPRAPGGDCRLRPSAGRKRSTRAVGLIVG